MHPAAIVRRLRALFARRRVDEEMREELALHLEMHARHLIEQGLSPNEARRQAMIEFRGMGQVMEAYRDARGVRPLEELVHDVRHALRSMRRQRTFAAAVVLTFAIGIGATTAIFSLLDAAWFSWSRSFEQPDRLAMLYKVWPSGRGTTSPADFRDWRRELRGFERIAGYIRGGRTLRAGGEPTPVSTVSVSHDFFDVLGMRPALGRFFREEEEQWGRHRVVVLSHAAWQRDFGGARDVIGRVITLDDAPSEIVGVAPPGAWFGPRPPALYLPISFSPTDPVNARHSHFVFVVGRLAPEVALETADAELRTLAHRIALEHRENEGTSAQAVELESVVLGDVKPTLRILLAAAMLVLLIACANVANLLIVRTISRTRELAVRSALGASAGRVARQLLTESVLLAIGGGLLGVLLAIFLVNAVGGSIPMELPRIGDTGIPIDWRVLAIALGAVLASGLACGLFPMVQVLRGTLSSASVDALRDGGRTLTTSRRSARVRAMLVTAQVAIALIMLVSSGLLARSLVRLQGRDTGIDPKDVVTVRLALPRERSLDPESTVRFHAEAIRRVRELPGVIEVGVSSHLPLAGGGETKPFWVEGRMPPDLASVPSVVGRMESARSLPTLGATLVAGRWFEDTDDASAPFVAIIGEAVARRFFPREDPIGQRISLFPPEPLYPPENLPPGGRWPRFTIVGVVKDVRYGDARSEIESAVYVHYPQGRRAWSWGPEWLVVKTRLPERAAINAIRGALRLLDPTLPLTDVLPLEDRMAQSLRAPRFTTVLVATFAAVAVLLGVIGLYGVIAYSVAQDTRSIGVRLALGATPGDIAGHVLRRGVVLSGAGLIAGLAGAALATRWLRSQLFEVTAMDPITYAAAAVALLGLALAASWLPARRAARTDAMMVLRTD